MAELTKFQQRKKESFIKSCAGDTVAGNAMFAIWLDAQPKKEDKPDPVAEVIVKALPADLKLGLRGYLVKRKRGKGASGYTAVKVDKLHHVL